MSDVAVIDAGVALAWFLDPPGERLDYSLSVLHVYKTGRLRFIVPDIFFAEVPYSLMKARNKDRISDAVMRQAARYVVPTSFSVQEAVARGEQWELKSYDATYFDLAVNLDIPLAAIDRDLVKKAGKFGVPLWTAGVG